MLRGVSVAKEKPEELT